MISGLTFIVFVAGTGGHPSGLVGHILSLVLNFLAAPVVYISNGAKLNPHRRNTMRYALWFGISAFLISGALSNAVAHDAEGVLGLAFVVGIAAAIYGAQLQSRQEQCVDHPGGKIYNISKLMAFHRVKDVLLQNHVNCEAWSFSQLDPESGMMTATLTFREQTAAFSSPGMQPQMRKIMLQVSFIPKSPTGTLVEPHWHVYSPLHRDECDTIIADLSKQFDQSLSQPTPLPA